jgi:hypothetical protein
MNPSIGWRCGVVDASEIIADWFADDRTRGIGHRRTELVASCRGWGQENRSRLPASLLVARDLRLAPLLACHAHAVRDSRRRAPNH